MEAAKGRISKKVVLKSITAMGKGKNGERRRTLGKSGYRPI